MQINSVTGVMTPNMAQPTDKPLFNQGERLKANVVSVDGRSVSLELENGSTLTASRSSNEVMRPGDTVTLEVDFSTSTSAQLKLVEVNSQPVMPDISREQAALLRVSYAPTASAAADLSLLNKLSIPASTVTLSRMAKVRQLAPEMIPARAALLASTDIPVDRANIKAFSAWLDSPVSASVLANALNEFSVADPASAKAVLEAFAANAGTSAAVGNATNETNATNATPNAPTAGTSLPNMPAVGAVLGDGAQQSSAPQGSMSAPLAVNGESVPTANAALPNAPAANAVPPDSPVIPAANGESTPAIGAAPLDAPTFGAAPLDPATVETALRGGPPDPALRGELTNSPPLRRVLGELFLKLADSASASRGEAVKEAVTRLPENVARLSSALGEAASRSQAAQPSLQASASLASQLSMGAELGGMLYTQIPLRNDSEHSTAELYIMKRDRGARNIDDANATVAICIETENLGRIESLVHIEKNDLTLRFRVENEHEAKFLKSRIGELRNMDLPAQYSLKGVSVVLSKEPLTLDNAARTMQREFSMPSAARGLDIQV